MPLQVGLWILFSTFQLFDTIRKGEVHNHPMFVDVCRDNAQGSDAYPQTRDPNYV
jgi:hypothetical protein